MKVLYFLPKNMSKPATKISMLARFGVSVIVDSPTPLSALSAMKIAKIVDREDVDIVEVGNCTDAMAAVSARKLTAKKFHITVNIEANTPLPKSITSDLRHGVDAWIFASSRLYDKYPADLSRKVLVPTVDYDAPIVSYPDISSSCVISWIGDIVDTDRLRGAIAALDDTDGGFELRICGTGKAADVMPAVRYSRGIEHSANVVWLADNYNRDAEITRAYALVRTRDDITVDEAAAMLSGRPILLPEEIAEFVKSPSSVKVEISPERNIDKIIGLYNDILIKFPK